MPIKSDLAKFLEQKQGTKKQALEMAERVANFIESHKDKFSKTPKSQWGAIRSICKEVAVSDKVLNDEGDEIENQTTAGKNKNIAAQISKFMRNGIRRENWDCEKINDEIILVKGGCGDTLVKAVAGDPCQLKFALLLSMQMQKITGEKQ